VSQTITFEGLIIDAAELDPNGSRHLSNLRGDHDYEQRRLRNPGQSPSGQKQWNGDENQIFLTLENFARDMMDHESKNGHHLLCRMITKTKQCYCGEMVAPIAWKEGTCPAKLGVSWIGKNAVVRVLLGRTR
jgi:hypothetical protein